MGTGTDTDTDMGMGMGMGLSMRMSVITGRGVPWPHPQRERPSPFVLSDDPADHGLGEAEVACIEKAYELRRRELQAAIERPEPFTDGRWLSELRWPRTLRGWCLALLLAPMVIPLVVVACATIVPLQYLGHRRDVARHRARLREELGKVAGRPFLTRLMRKSLFQLWRIYGFNDRRFDEAVGVELASWWIDRLYGPGTTRALRLEERLEQVSRRRARLRDGTSNVICVSWIPRLEEVLREISSELPPCDWGQRDGGKQDTLH